MVQSRRSKYLACLLVAAATSGALYAKPDLDLAPSFESLDLTTVLRICPPKVQLPTPDDERCTSNTAESIAATQKMQLYTEPFWALVELRNNTKDDRIYVLEHLLAITERVAVEELSDKAAAIKVAGEGASVYARDYRAPLPAYRLQFKAGETKILRISIRSDLVTRMGFTLHSERHYIDELQVTNVLHAGFYGLMFSMILFNLLLYLRLRLRMYLYYVLFIMSISVMYMGLFGHGFAFIWPDAFLWQKYSHSAAKFTAAIFGIAFFSAVLNVPQRMPRLYGKIKLAYPAFVVAAVVSPLLSPQGIFLIATIVVAIAVIYSLALGVLSAVGKLPFSFYYAIAMIAMLGGALINLLQTAAILPSNTFTLHAMQVGTALEAIFLSIALGDRYSAIEGENHALQHQRLEDKKRIARDIHDVIGTEFQMRLIEIQSEGESALSSKLVSGLRSTLDKIREFLFLLHTEEHLPAKLEKTIEELLRRLELAKKFEIERDIIIDAQAIGTTEAYHIERAVSEIISNIARHAQASKIVFTLRINKQGGFLAVRDNGVGFEKTLAAKNIGMESLGYRAERLRGRLKILTSMGRGTTVALRFRGQA
jgi:signal transduction histidine kinase